jgi:hypothetical protein
MRLPRVRFIILWIILVVLGAGTILGVSVEWQRRRDRFLRRESAPELEGELGVEWRRRRDRFLGLAEHHEASIRITKECGPRYLSATNDLGEDVRGWSSARIKWHRRLGEKYRLAASRPWMPVEPDPPQP